MKIYEADIYSGTEFVLEIPTIKVKDGETKTLGGFDVEFFYVSGHSVSSVVYRIRDLLFTGDAIGAGRLGDSPNDYARSILKTTILERFSHFESNLLIFPGHGPPSTLEVEKKFNPAFAKDSYSPED